MWMKFRISHKLISTFCVASLMLVGKFWQTLYNCDEVWDIWGVFDWDVRILLLLKGM